jgi:hypothetical protein
MNISKIFSENANESNVSNIQRLVLEYHGCTPISRTNFELCCSKIMNLDGNVAFSHSSGLTVSSVLGARAEFRMVDKKFTLEKGLQFCRTLDVISLKNFGRLAYYCNNDDDNTDDQRNCFRKQDNSIVEDVFEQFDNWNVEKEYEKSFAILETHNKYKYKIGTGKSATTHEFSVPWVFEEVGGEDLDDTTLDNLVQRGPCLSPWHIDFMRFGSKVFIPDACHGTIKLWFIGTVPSHLEYSMFQYLRKLSLTETGTTFDRNNTFMEAVFRYVKLKQLIIILMRAGQVVHIPPGIPHAVMTCYSNENPERFCLLLGKNLTSNTDIILSCKGGIDLKTIKKEVINLRTIGEFQNETVYSQVVKQLNDKITQFAKGVNTKKKRREIYRFSSFNNPHLKKREALQEEEKQKVQKLALGKRPRFQTDHYGHTKK